jgi:hypothetical protein
MMLSGETDLVISDDRKTLAYGFDDVLVCRNADDLSVRWTRSIEPDRRASQVAVTAHGTRVAAVITGDKSNPSFVPYAAIYDGTDGALVTRVQLNKDGRIALPPAGNQIAIAAREPSGDGHTATTVRIYELPSGKTLALAVHARVKNGRHSWLLSDLVLAFTSNGKYLVTSGMSTKVWGLAT